MNIILEKAKVWLNEMGVNTKPDSGPLLGVSRDDMVNLAASGTFEEDAYNEVLKGLREALDSKKLFWAMKDDDYLYLDSF